MNRRLLTPYVIDLATEITHQRLSFSSHSQSHWFKVTRKDLAEPSLNLSSSDIDQIMPQLNHYQGHILKSIGDMIYEDAGMLYSPLGYILNTKMLQWMGGCFDGDGCVSSQSTGCSSLYLGQNGAFVELFHHSFGGVLLKRKTGLVEWSIKGRRSCIVARILHRVTYKKREELGEVIKLHKGKISRMEYKESIRKLKDDYCKKQFAMKSLTYPTLAGLIDSDGCITITYKIVRGKEYFYPKVCFCQSNKSMCEGFKSRFGGNVYRRDGSNFEWCLETMQ